MKAFPQVAASQLSIGVGYQKGFEHKGILFIPPAHIHFSEAMGRQFSKKFISVIYSIITLNIGELYLNN
ncbi:hypothetical protein [Acinetobacter oleivorans]|uniref:hypothetical protein n=1 Tax=Acinetobacter oleivorans TaxID=1148157 RepID=UPI0013A6A21C|nr:hypothetical protein [Acinetobacter oleivorans]